MSKTGQVEKNPPGLLTTQGGNGDWQSTKVLVDNEVTLVIPRRGKWAKHLDPVRHS
jgi:hypothetical protein